MTSDRRTILSAFVISLSLAGCADLGQRREQPRPAEAIESRAQLSDRQLQERTLGVLALVIDDLQSLAMPDTREERVLCRELLTACLALAAIEEPREAILATHVTFSIERAMLAAEATLSDPTSTPARIDATLSNALRATRQTLEELITPAEFAQLEALAQAWINDHPSPRGAQRFRIASFSSLRSEPATPIEPSLPALPPSDAAALSLATSRLQFVLRYLPAVARWEVLDASEAFAASSAVSGMRQAIDGGSAALDRLSSSITAADATARALQQAVEAIEPGDLAPAQALASEVRLAIAEAKTVLPDAQRTILELREAMTGAERVTTALKELTRGPDGKPIDFSQLGAASERFAAAATDLRSAMQQANALLASDDATRRLAELTDTGKKGVDHVIWRIALLMVIAAALSMVLMVVRSLTRPRSEPNERARRSA